MRQINLADLIRNIPDFPIPGVQFKDITTLLSDGPAFQQVVDTFAARYANRAIDAIAGVESRGFIFSAPLAYRLGIGLVPIRKHGKLPAATHQVEYALEYGSNVLEIHRDDGLSARRRRCSFCSSFAMNDPGTGTALAGPVSGRRAGSGPAPGPALAVESVLAWARRLAAVAVARPVRSVGRSKAACRGRTS